MPYYFLILLLFLFGIQYPILRIIYPLDNWSYGVSKVLNLIIAVYLIWNLSSENNLHTLIFYFKELKSAYLIRAGLISPIANFISHILSILFNVYMIVIVFNLIKLSAKYRKAFINFIPLWSLFYALGLNHTFFILDSEMKELRTLLVSLGISTVHGLILFLIYRSKSFKKMMCFDKQQIRKMHERSML